jgi:outer membrane protein OmpA-like peptidoglycan-associated protein
MKLRSALVAATLMTLPAVAMAQPVDGLYVGAGAGYNWTQDQSIKTAPFGKLRTDGGVLGSASVGFGFGNGFRFEIQGDYRNEHQRPNTPAGASSVLNQTYGGFANALFDFDVGAGYVFPYVGVGVGYEETRLSNSGFGADYGSVAAQGILGVSFPIPDMPGLSATAEYRFMSTLENEKFSDHFVDHKVGPSYNHAGLIGLRYVFGLEAEAPMAPAPTPAPTVQPAPTPPPARTYLVFFDWDRSDLTAAARQIIATAAQNVAKVQVTRIEVSGHADLSGTHAYNQGLSERRAKTVAAELVKDGVPQNEIDVKWYGDTHPLVPTAPGVREPQNRRVEIVLK